MKKVIYLIIFVLFVLNVMCFADLDPFFEQQMSRDSAFSAAYVIMSEHYPIKEQFNINCPNCNCKVYLIRDYAFYEHPYNYKFRIGACKSCGFLKVNYYNHCVYRGTK